MTTAPLFYSTTEAAQRLGVSSEHVRGMIKRGQLKGERFGRKILVPCNEIARLAGEPTEQGHEALSSRTDQSLIRELRQVLARAQALLAELE